MDKTDLIEKRFMPALCNFKNSHIFVSGGGSDGDKSVERYDIGRDTWQMMPSMNRGRKYHASVALGNHVYVICGFNSRAEDRNRHHKSMERLNASQVDRGAPQWQLIQILQETFAVRQLFVAVAVSDTEIAILGGKNDYQRAYLSDVVIFDETRMVLTQKIQLAELFGFINRHNQAHFVNKKVFMKVTRTGIEPAIYRFGMNDPCPMRLSRLPRLPQVQRNTNLFSLY